MLIISTDYIMLYIIFYMYRISTDLRFESALRLAQIPRFLFLSFSFSLSLASLLLSILISYLEQQYPSLASYNKIVH